MPLCNGTISSWQPKENGRSIKSKTVGALGFLFKALLARDPDAEDEVSVCFVLLTRKEIRSLYCSLASMICKPVSTVDVGGEVVYAVRSEGIVQFVQSTLNYLSFTSCVPDRCQRILPHEGQDCFMSNGGDHFVTHGVLAPCEQQWLRKLADKNGVDAHRLVSSHSAAAGNHNLYGFEGSGFPNPVERKQLVKICSRITEIVSQRASKMQFLDFAMVNQTAGVGHAPHVDNERCILKPSGGAAWVPSNSGHRSWSISVMLSEPWEYEGGEFVFYDRTGLRPIAFLKERAGSMIAFRGDRHHIHGVLPISAGHRFVLLVFLREVVVSAGFHEYHHREGTGKAVFLELSDLRLS